MTFLMETLTFTTNASTGNQAITLDSGIWGGATGSAGPQCAIFSGGGASADGISAHALLGFGVAVSSTSRGAVAIQSENATGTTDTDRRQTNAKTFTLLDNAGAVYLEFDFVSFTANTMTINITTAVAVLINVTLIGGTETQAYLKEVISTAGTGNKSYTGVGFQPNALIGFGGGLFAGTSTSAGATASIGVYDGTTGRMVWWWTPNNAGTSDTKRLMNSSLLGLSSTGSLPYQEAAGVSLDADGFTLNWIRVTAGFAFQSFVLCLNVPNAVVKTITQPASNNTVSTAVGFAPDGAVFLSAMSATAGTVQDHARMLVGHWSDGSGQACAGAVDEDGQATTDADRVQDSNEAVKMIDHTQTVVGSATASASGNNVDLVFTDCDTTQREIAALIFGAAAGTSIPIFAYHYNHNIGANI